jgi:hypothetical protein
MTYLPPQAFPPCPNDSLRKENPAALRIEYSSANLPDCRAFEQATPVDKDGGDVTGMVTFERASSAGGAIVYLSVSSGKGGVGSQEIPVFLAKRATDSWSSRGLLPPATFGQQGKVIGWTPDFADVFTQATLLGEPPTTTMLDDHDGAEPNTIVDYVSELQPRYAGASTGAAQVLFESTVAILAVAGAVAGVSNLYVWDRKSQQIRLAGVMNDGQAPPKGAIAGPYDWVKGTTPQTLASGGADSHYYTQEEHAISADGKAIYFTAAGSGELYVRLNPTEAQSALDGEGKCTQPDLACTVQVNESQKTNGKSPGGTDPAGAAPAAFMGASADGSKSLFTSTEMLTDDANTGPEQEAAAIVRANLDGTDADRAFVPTHASDIKVDGEHIYWVDLDKGTIARAKLDGTGVEDEFITATDNTRGLAVGNGHIYWTNGACVPDQCAEGEGEGTIGRAQLGPSGAEEVEQDFIPNAGNAWAVAVNAEHLYWTRTALTGDGRPFVGRAKADGTEVEREFIKTFFDGARLPGIALDSGHVYWMEVDPLDHSVISRADLDGGKYLIEFIIVGASAIDRTKHGRGIAIQDNQIYWAAQGTNEIGRAKLNGDEAASEIEFEFIKSAGHPYGVAADTAHLYWSANGEASLNPGNDLYRYDTKADPKEALVDLAPDSTNANGVEVRGVLGASADASYVYFAANGVPDGVTNSPNGRGEEAEAGDCPALLVGSSGGECNLYLVHHGTVEFIARLEVGGGYSDVANWVPSSRAFLGEKFQQLARVTPDGRTLLFRAQRQLSDYPNEGVAELYRFQAGESAARCVSCDPSGEAPSGAAGFFGQISPSTLIPSPPAATLTHNLSTDGNRVFFETTDALVAADTNGEEGCPLTGAALQKFAACTDVYEWEAVNSGSCDATHAVAPGGCIYLISTGKGDEPALIADASPDGKDIFLYTRSRLVGQDEDSLFDIYDAREQGGLVAQNPPPPPICLSTEACHSNGSQPAEIPLPPKFSGPGNPKSKPQACPKGKHKVKGRCVKTKKHHKKAAKGKAKAKGRAGR